MSDAAGRVSVALCTHNGEQYIDQQLTSIFAQTRLPDEIVLSDDASTDNTVAVARTTFERFATAHPASAVNFVVVTNDQPLKVAKNFERAILRTTGDLIVLCDQDDEWMPHRIQRGIDAFAARPKLLLLHSDAILVDGAGKNLGQTLFQAYEVTDELQRQVHDGRAFDVLIRRNVVTGATTMLRRELGLAAAPFPEGWVHDEWLGIVASVLGELDLVEEPLIKYRQHGLNEIGAEVLGLRAKFARLIEPGAERNAQLFRRASSLAAWATTSAHRIPDYRVAAIIEKLGHERMRRSLSPSRFARIPAIARELPTRRYGRFGRGLSDAARDLLQPLHAPR